MFDQVNVDKYPTLTDLGTGNLARTGLFLQRHGVDVKEVGGCLQIKRLHNVGRDRALVLDRTGGSDTRGKGSPVCDTDRPTKRGRLMTLMTLVPVYAVSRVCARVRAYAINPRRRHKRHGSRKRNPRKQRPTMVLSLLNPIPTK